MRRTFGWLLLVVAAAAALLSGYGWWFHFSVGPTHGAGREIGIAAGLASIASCALGWWLRNGRRG